MFKGPKSQRPFPKNGTKWRLDFRYWIVCVSKLLYLLLWGTIVGFSLL